MDSTNSLTSYINLLVDGAWATWTPWSGCTVTCGGGNQTKNRTCTQPPPAHGGATCEGDETEIKPCNINQCKGAC